MTISEQELRTMIRQAIAAHGGGAAQLDGPDLAGGEGAAACRSHASHGLLAIVASTDGDCLIEPTVRCNHCGYCKSLGH
jgi:hypothetical protein